MKFFVLIISFFIYQTTNAHPGTGLVQDRKGNIFYTDLEHVWKISPEGIKSIAVKNVHTHHLYMDANYNLYGQHSIYSGEATNKWYHYLWRLNANGSLDTIRGVTEGFYIENFSFTRDENENMYWVKIGNPDKIIRTSKNGVNTELISGDFKKVQWMHYSNGKLYFVQEDDVFSLTNKGILQKMASDLSGREKAHNSLFGIWGNKRNNNIYVANSDYHKIQQIDTKGVITDFYTSKAGWFPTSGLFDLKNNLWVMEVNDNNEVRVFRADKQFQKSSSLQQLFSNNATVLILAICSLIAIISIVIQRKNLPVTEN
jgi:hypothetical protein